MTTDDHLKAAAAIHSVVSAVPLQRIGHAPVIAELFRTEIIYTLGRRDIYDPYIASDRRAAKGAGGSVWRTRADVQAYLDAHPLPDFAIYGVVVGSWERDTRPVADGSWHELIENACLKTL